MSAGHEKITSHDDRAPPSEKSFGQTFAVVFGIVGFWPLVIRGASPHYWALAVGIGFLAVAYFAPKVLGPFNRLWFKFGMLLHKVVNPVVLGIMFLVIVTPIAVILRLLGKRLIPLKFDKTAASYWIVRTPPGPAPESLRNQF